jgi:acyl-CoA thioester hydrolase
MKKIIFELDIYTFHIDYANHVSNIVYIQWMEIGRLKLLEAVGLPVNKISDQGFMPVLVSTSISYKIPLYLGDVVQIELWLSELMKASACLEFCFYNGKRDLVATALQKGLFVDKKTQRPRRLLSEERQLFDPYFSNGSNPSIICNEEY